MQKLVQANKEIMNTLLVSETQGGITPIDASASTSLETSLSQQFKKQIELLEQRNASLEKQIEEG